MTGQCRGGELDQIVIHSCADEVQAPKPNVEAWSEADVGIGHQYLVDGL
jgi:hypothetical protein